MCTDGVMGCIALRFKAKRYKGSGITTSGLASNFTFTPVQVILRIHIAQVTQSFLFLISQLSLK